MISPELIAEFVDAAAEDEAKAERLLKENPELRDARWRSGETPLHFYAIENFPDAVRFLGRLGFDVNATNEHGETALGDAVLLGNGAVLEILLELGAEPNVVANIGYTPLEWAVVQGRADLVERLLEGGADIEFEGQHGGVRAALESSCPPEAKALILAALRAHGLATHDISR